MKNEVRNLPNNDFEVLHPKDEPKADADGDCTVCGNPLEDPKELTHECPPGFKSTT